MDVSNTSLPQNYTIGQLFTKLFKNILSFGIKPDQPQYKANLLEHLSLQQKIKLFCKNHHKYFNDNIRDQILEDIENSTPIKVQTRYLLKWLYLQDDTTYQQYHPLIINIVLNQQNGELNYQSHKYISLLYKKLLQSQSENVKLFLKVYRDLAQEFMMSQNSRNRILLKLQLNKQLELNYPLNQIEQDCQKYQDLENLDHIKFYLKYQGNLEWLLKQIITKKVINHNHKTEVLELVNHIIKTNLCEQYYSQLFDQIMDAFEPEEVFYHELYQIFHFLLIVKDYPEMILVQLFRIFADKHMLFDPQEFSAIVLLVNQFQEVNIQDQHQTYQISIYDELRDYYLKNSLSMTKEVHQIFIRQTTNKLG
ncbi:unnamed protein product (macronuclear) [Paramecium tetraurelia]|uniref:Rab-GAP TBC domain-containing protein n=1 Tax=Paramecium tetraurelia TaxID=5888 RepID=A0BEB5_PARTE|nr:uncharacterized protein GSPATT00027915001 [Paramecium tetraurelia]CAK56882.1 unnamed protein product [Paramecium tetraurelia]|eukprot:XP_001424280.1 hypothetical protein (macronuclear) [Paramecium tetraurelia strain d4-2]